MRDIVGSLPENKITAGNDVIRRDDAVARVRALEKQISTAEGDACRLRMEQGDVLVSARDSIARGRWLVFLADCRLEPRNAQIAMQLAAKRTEIEAAYANRDSHPSIAAALRLIRPKKPGGTSKPKTPVAPPITVDAVITWLANTELSPTDRARIVAALHLAAHEVPPALTAASVQHEVAKANQEAEEAKATAAALARTLKQAESALATGASAKNQNADIRAILKHRSEMKNATYRFTPESRVLFTSPAPPSDEALQLKLGRGKNAMIPGSTSLTPTKPALITDAPPTETKQ